uniref:MAGUK p55 subfamily member 7 n=1 Tax=Glossina austeni TaxID=7395 RepID=A0A1A9VI81_GLOAU
MTAEVMAASDANYDPALSKLITTLKEAETLSNDQEIDFLKALLESKELNALVNVHTKVAKVGRDDRLAPMLSNSAVGATIKTEEETGKIIIARIMHGGAADRSGLIHVGDEVIEVNGINVEGKTPGDVLSILQNSEGTITFKLVPSDGKGAQRESKVRVRAHFDYSPDVDPYIPCKEAGLAFQRGDILHIVSQDDAYWWQARRESERTARAGLIPSRALQERRLIHERTQREVNDSESKKGSCASICTTPPASPLMRSSSSSSSCRQPKTKKIMYDLTENDDFDREMIATYEEVAKLYPRPGVFRPVVLIGAPGVGRNELRRRLIARDSEKYRSPVPYTTRPMRTGEVAGREYIFVTREKMEADIEAGKFVEHGEYKGHLYGTSGESVKSIINAGCVCLLSPHYQAIKALRTVQLKPFIVHIKPPEFEILKKTRTEARAKSTFDETNTRGFTLTVLSKVDISSKLVHNDSSRSPVDFFRFNFQDDEFNDMIKSAERIDFLYGHFFDEEIQNGDLVTAFEKLVNTVQRIENEPLWAPASWVQ